MNKHGDSTMTIVPQNMNFKGDTYENQITIPDMYYFYIANIKLMLD